jgi:hypothetical protein
MTTTKIEWVAKQRIDNPVRCKSVIREKKLQEKLNIKSSRKSTKIEKKIR